MNRDKRRQRELEAEAKHEGGLRPGAAAWLGFTLVCRCGHEDGMHEHNHFATGSAGKCAAADCKCAGFEKEKTREEIGHIPALLLTDYEVSQTDPDFQAYVKRVRERRDREAACPGHEALSTSTYEETRRGDHRAHCKHCGKDMSVDSGG